MVNARLGETAIMPGVWVPERFTLNADATSLEASTMLSTGVLVPSDGCKGLETNARNGNPLV